MILTKPAKYISYLFIPPVMNLFIFTVLSIIKEDYPKSFQSILVSFSFGLLFPLVAILYFRKKGIISNNDATIKEERKIPYIYAIFFSLAGVISSGFLELNSVIIMLWMVYLLNSIIILNINRFWKISAHTVGASIPLGALYFVDNQLWLLVSLVILAIVAFARLYLKVHTLSQVLAGAVLGFLLSYVSLNYFL